MIEQELNEAVRDSFLGEIKTEIVERAMTTKEKEMNQIMVIKPYRYAETWVFDDEAVGLKKEPFVYGIPAMIDYLTRDIPNAQDGFRMLFSAQPFPGFQEKLTWVRGEMDGNFYWSETLQAEGWLCPALFKYFNQAPAEIYVKVEQAGK